MAETVAGMRNMLFPGVCLACAEPVIEGAAMLCPFCQQGRFDPANPWYKDTCGGVILPDTVRFQHAMWLYDKGGVLQRLLHHIKYGGMGKLGYELGKLAGVSLLQHPALETFQGAGGCCLLPVPLHPRRKRMRGFNQAEVIALGISEVTGFPVLDESTVERRRYTNTQTGFSLQERSKNMASAFVVLQKERLENKTVIIVDDVFTTGATTFALAAVVKASEMSSVAIVTIAHA